MLASPRPAEGQTRPKMGDMLMVIHDFQARSSDELSLSKGDRVELIERDDEFGDGWFLGRHLVNGNTGLFPEVYTRPQPVTAPAPSLTPALAASIALPPLDEVKHELATADESQPASPEVHTAVTPPRSVTPRTDEPSFTLPLSSVKPESSSTRVATSHKSAPVTGLAQLNNPSQDSQVLNDTLNVINEHITDLRSPQSNGGIRVSATDSGSEYSVPLDHRMSYIQGEETDEEEDGSHTRSEVESWTPDDVAEYLFTAGVESHHCEVFRDQEISGEVLLGMDQSSLFIKAFDLGSVGRRLKTWHKIKALQDEVGDHGLETRRTTQTYGSDVSPDEPRRRSRTNTMTTPAANRMSVQSKRMSMSQTPKASPTNLTTPASPQSIMDSPTRPSHTKRPSAASVRELHHSRRHSSTDFRISGAAGNATPRVGTLLTNADIIHKKQASFDRNWTLGSAFGQPIPMGRPLSSAGVERRGSSDPDLQDSAVDLDRGYFSGTETDNKKRNVLRKRDSDQSRKDSYAEEQRVRTATAISRHSRFGSVDSYRDGAPSTAAQKYYGVQSMPHRRTASTNTTESIRPLPPAKDGPSPTVTKLEGRSQPSPAGKQGFNTDWLTSVVQKPMSRGRPGMRAISEKLTIDRSKMRAPTDPLPSKGLSIDSPVSTGLSTPSGAPSFEIDSPDATKSPSSAGMVPAPKNTKRKNKKETSAYTRGLLKIGPQEAKIDAEYFGWMKKKSSNLMTTWKPRLFVLKGRRLAYYYSEDDDQEKGLIDISFHRVLPADNERLTGLHATITGAVGGGSIPQGSEGPLPLEKGDDSIFIFKLVPPRAGLSRAVNFTKPTVHYFAVPNLTQGRLWMAALMKATIDRDDAQPITTTYQQKTISLAKAKQMRHRPPALMNLEESAEEEQKAKAEKASNGLGIFGESDNGATGINKPGAPKVASARLNVDFGEKDGALPPLSA